MLNQARDESKSLKADVRMGFHGIQLLGISIVLAALASGSTFLGNAGGVYTPNTVAASYGVIVTLIGVIADPLIEIRLRRFKG